MKLLITDYDGTLKSNIKNLYINIESAKKFMSSGNKFGIATGRCFNSIKKEIDKYNIEYDYLICNNGLIIFDKENNILRYSLLCEKDLNYIYSLIKQSRDVEEFKLYSFYTSTIELKEIMEVYAKFRSVKSAKTYKKYIESLMPNIICYRDGNMLFISNKLTKSNAVSFIQNKDSIEDENIYTVGDNLNDLDMLEEFNGYKMLKSYPNLWFKKFPITKEVHTLIKKINR